MNAKIAVAVAAAIAALPLASADLNVQTFYWASAYVDFYNGLGIYDPAATANTCFDPVPAVPCPGVTVREPDEDPNYCAALLHAWLGVQTPTYYDLLRIYPTAGLTAYQAPVADTPLPPPLDDCLTLAPPLSQQLANDGLGAGAGGAVFLRGALARQEVAVLGTTTIAVEYCPTFFTVPAAGAGPYGLALMAQDVACNNSLGSYVFPAGCLDLTTTPGLVHANQPIFLSEDTGVAVVDVLKGDVCNSQIGSPALVPGMTFVSEFCMLTDTFDVITGTTTVAEEDTDWFVNLQGLGVTIADLLWATTPGNIADLSGNLGTSPFC